LPLSFEAGAGVLEQLAASRIVEQQNVILNSSDDGVVQRCFAGRPDSDDKWTSSFQVMLEIAPRASENKGLKSILLKILFHCGGVKSGGGARVEGALYGGGVSIGRAARLPGPILHDHGNAGRTTTLGLLFDKGNVEPHGVTRAEQEAEQHRDERRRNNATHTQ